MIQKTIYALGFFDGVHLGHAALLRTCLSLARENGCDAGVVTFAAHPDTLVLGSTPGLINTAADRERLLRRLFAMDTVVTLPFDEHMKHMPWQDFLRMLLDRYGAAGFVCGEDFRFGFLGRGDAGSLGAFCREMGLPWAVVPEQTLEGERISSTRIRERLQKGDMAGAVRLLGHPHILTGPVVHGHQLGRTLGIPTANLHLPVELAVPRFGVYACRCSIDGRSYPAVTNIGTRPTVSGRGVTVEPWILDYEGDLYGRELTLEFFEFLRPEQKFPSLEAMKEEIHRNAAQTRRTVPC
ncbi:MAG: riboflavin biosynthesis protein RibF [Eubacteriales bacterium]|nr:riboflavin biosynthesis protein RibF [Eubacteriales bacterium]